MSISRDDVGSECNTARRLFWEKCASESLNLLSTSEQDGVTLTRPEATRFTYMDRGRRKHWFGRLTNLEGLKGANQKTLYKGGIRDFGKELFSYESEATGEDSE